ncbi:MAG: hypothetical protein FWC15_03820 [Fibromonadales bacterium]|nr:hypothetical protein [Fibromonadales bacterium]
MKTNFFSLAMLVSLLAFGFSLTSCGPSKAVLAIQAAASIEEVQGLENKLIWLQANAKPDGNYVIEIEADEQITSSVEQLRGTITLRGVGANRTISYARASMFSKCPHSMFSVHSGTTLILDNNITLKPESCSSSMVLVSIRQRGTFVMNDGSAITGGRSKGGGGGVVVGRSGTFLMKGGTISGNTNYRGYIKDAGFGKYYVHIRGTAFGGGGVWVDPTGTFIKTGGTIANNSVEDIRSELTFRNEKGDLEIRIPANVPEMDRDKFIQEQGYISVNGFGSQIYFEGENPKAIDNSVGSDMNFHFSNGVFSEGKQVPSDVPVETQEEDEP